MIKPLPVQLRYKMDQGGNKLPLTEQEQKKWLKHNPFTIENFHYILMNRKVSEQFIKKVIDKYGLPPYDDEKISFNSFYYWSTISEQFIRQFKQIFEIDDWTTICCGQNLSKDFVREMNEYLGQHQWSGICARQILPIQFIRQNRNKINWVTLIRRGVISEKQYEEIFGKQD